MEIDKVGTEFVENVDKLSKLSEQKMDLILYDVGNFVNVSNFYGTQDVNFVTGDVEAFKKLELKTDGETYTQGTINANVDAKVFDIGRAKTKGFEYNTTVGTTITGGHVHIHSSSNNVAKHYLFDIEMFSHITITSSQSFTNGETITGGTSGATATVKVYQEMLTNCNNFINCAMLFVITMKYLI